MPDLTDEQYIQLANKLIIEVSKIDPKYDVENFTGGSVITARHYGKITYKVDLYFGFNKANNSINHKLPITESIAFLAFKALDLKNRSLLNKDVISDSFLDDLVTTSLRSSNDIVPKVRYDIGKGLGKDKGIGEAPEEDGFSPTTILLSKLETVCTINSENNQEVARMVMNVPEEDHQKLVDRCKEMQDKLIEDGLSRYKAINLIPTALQTLNQQSEEMTWDFK